MITAEPRTATFAETFLPERRPLTADDLRILRALVDAEIPIGPATVRDLLAALDRAEQRAAEWRYRCQQLRAELDTQDQRYREVCEELDVAQGMVAALSATNEKLAGGAA